MLKYILKAIDPQDSVASGVLTFSYSKVTDCLRVDIQRHGNSLNGHVSLRQLRGENGEQFLASLIEHLSYNVNPVS